LLDVVSSIAKRPLEDTRVGMDAIFFVTRSARIALKRKSIGTA